MIVAIGRGCAGIANTFWMSGEKVIANLPPRAPMEHFVSGVIVTRSNDELAKAIRDHMEPSDKLGIAASPHTTSDRPYLRQLANGIKIVFDLRKQDFASVAKWEEVWHLQAIENLPKLAKLNRLVDFQLRNVPAIVVGPGPSLVKNIGELEKARGRVIIIALQRAINQLNEAGIIPHAVVVVDSAANVAQHIIGRQVGPILALEQSCHPSLFDLPARYILWYDGRGGRVGITDRIFRDVTSMPGGGTVAASAVGAALKWGCNPIATCGIDLAYSDDGKRYDGAKDDKRTRVKLPRWHGGGTVTSTMDLVATHTWLKAAAAKLRRTRFFNCVEGGAFIQGWRHIKLDKFIKRYLKREIDIAPALARLDERKPNKRDILAAKKEAAELKLANEKHQAALMAVLRRKWS